MDTDPFTVLITCYEDLLYSYGHRSLQSLDSLLQGPVYSHGHRPLHSLDDLLQAMTYCAAMDTDPYMLQGPTV